MQKGCALLSNEMRKIILRPVTWIILLIMVLFTCLITGIGYISLKSFNDLVSTADLSTAEIDQDIEEQIKNVESNLAYLQKEQQKAKSMKGEFTPHSSPSSMQLLQLQLKILQTYRKQHLNTRSGGSGILYELLNNHFSPIYAREDERHVILANAAIEQLCRNITSDYETTFKAYIKILAQHQPTTNAESVWIKRRIDSVEQLLASLQSLSDEKKLQALNANYRSLIDIIKQREKLQNTLELGYFDTSYSKFSQGTLLDEGLREQLQSRIQANTYQLEHHTYLLNESESTLNSVLRISFSSRFFVTMLLIVLTGNIIAGEISSGAIKMMLISPIKRSRIYWSKFLALSLMGLFLVLLHYLLCMLIALPFIGGLSNPQVIQYANSYIVVPQWLEFLLSSLISYYFIWCVMIFTYAASCLIRSSGFAIAIGTCAYMGRISVAMFNYNYLGSFWLNILPYPHILQVENILPTDSILLVSAIASNQFELLNFQPNLWFSALYLGLFTVALLWVGRDSFCKRDIS